MIIHKWVEFAEEIEINISVEDITLILESSGDDDFRLILEDMSKAIIYLKAIPQKVIDKMSLSQKETVLTFLTSIMEHIKNGKDIITT